MKFKNIRSVALLGLLLSTSACEKDIFDINTDPNNPTTADINLVLPSGQAFVSFVVGGQFNIMGEILTQHMGIPSGANQYRSYDQYNIPSSTFDGRQFQNLYAGALQDFQNVIDQGTPAGESRMVGIAKILKAHTYQVLTDVYGDLPYSDALKGTSSPTPKYDKQEDIYKGLQLLLDDAINDINQKQGRFPGTADLNYQANNEAGMSRWIRLANTLKLRLYMRTSEVDPAGAAAGIRALYAKGAASAVFMNAGEGFQFNNGTAANSENPFYQANFRLQNNLAASTTIGTIMTATEDPRRPVYFLDADLKTAPIDYLFVEPGRSTYVNNINVAATPPVTTLNAIRYSFPGTYFIGQAFTNGGTTGANTPGIPATDAAAKSRPTLLLTYEESLFLRAEAAARGWATTTEVAKTLYESGVTASMTRYGVAAAATTTYLTKATVAFPATGVADQVKAISTQKWLSYYATNGMEAWSDQRRTNNPPRTAPIVNTLGAGLFVNRLPYVDSELTRNTANVQAVGLAPGDVQTKVWWDVN